jgi:hypothetical protein
LQKPALFFTHSNVGLAKHRDTYVSIRSLAQVFFHAKNTV